MTTTLRNCTDCRAPFAAEVDALGYGPHACPTCSRKPSVDVTVRFFDGAESLLLLPNVTVRDNGERPSYAHTYASLRARIARMYPHVIGQKVSVTVRRHTRRTGWSDRRVQVVIAEAA